MLKLSYIDEAEIKDKRVLLRVDYNVTLNPDFSIADDARIRQSIPTIEHLLKNNNKIIIISHLGRPKGREDKFSLKPVVETLKQLIKNHEIILLENFRYPEAKILLKNQTTDYILVLENIRYFQEEKNNDESFARELSSLGDIFVNDAFGVSHRNDASVVGIS